MSWIDFEAGIFKDYINYVEDYFDEKNKEIGTQFDALESIPLDDPVRQIEDNYHESQYDAMEDTLGSIHFFNEEFQQRFRYAIVIQLFSLLERYLKKVTSFYATKNNIDPKKLRGSMLTKANKILQPQLKLASFEPFNRLQLFTELRNVIVHHNGSTSDHEEDKKYLDKLLQLERISSIELKISEGPKMRLYEIVVPDKSFLLSTVDDINNLFKEIDFGLRKYRTDTHL